MELFKIKICGVTRASDIAAIAEAGADAVGLNFFAQSKRFVPPQNVASLAAAIPDSLRRVGVFVNASFAEISKAVEQARLDFVQLHGDESPSQVRKLVAALPALQSRVIRAFRLQKSVAEEIDPYLAECQRQEVQLAAILVDAWHPSEYGGTGKTADWNGLREWVSKQSLPVILAGGLTPQNVAEAIKAVRPFGVDTASGVESAPGEKNADLVRAFVEKAKASFV